MHVLQLLPRLEVGGVERGVLDLTAHLVRLGHRVSVVSNGGVLVERLTRLGAAHYRLPVHAKSLKTIRACLPAVAQLITSTGVDVVHARSRVPGWIGWAAARRTQRPFVTTAHGFYRPHLGSRVMVWGRLVIAPSEALGAYLVQRFGLPRARLRVIPRGVDLDEFAFRPPSGPHDGPWRIGLFGRLSPLKGQAVAVRACAQLVRQRIPVRLCLAGDLPGSPLRRELDALIAQLRLQDNVEWHGLRADIPQLIASMDVVIVPSTYPESFGRGVIEAQAVGRPVVASRIGALAELIQDERTGLLVAPGNVMALAEGIARFIQEPALRTRCVEAGREQAVSRWDARRMAEQTLAVYDECLTRPRILVWKMSALGDVVLSTPSLRAIRRRFPQAHLAMVVGSAAYEVIARCPYLTDIILYDPHGKDRGVRRLRAFIKRLRAERFDYSIDLQNSRATHAIAWWAGIPVRLGYRRKFGWLLNQAVRLPRVVLTPLAHQQYLLERGGIVMDDQRLELWPSPLDEQRAEALLKAAPEGGVPATLIGVHPGGSGRWKTKRWPLERWAQLCGALARQQMQVVVFGGPEERALGERLASLAAPAPRVLIGQTSLMELACLIRRCRVFVAHDSSSLHLAAAVGTPTVALFGPTDPRRHLPPAFNGRVIKKDVFCSPCYATRCRTITHACMNRVDVKEVLDAVLTLLDQPSACASSR